MSKSSSKKEGASIREAGPSITESPNGKPDREEIAKLAYLLAEARGFQGGSPEEDWLRAEEELKHQLAERAS